jgi:sensor c-di-GMP phosphodiesterase-like protein
MHMHLFCSCITPPPAIINTDKAIVLAIFAIAHSLKLDVVAEVVKTEDQRQFIFDGTALTTKCIF